MSELTLRPLRAVDLAIVGPWFDDAEIQRWLAGRAWPVQLLALIDPQVGRFGWIAVDGGRPVGLLDVERNADGSASFAIVVDPALRRRGLARRTLQAMLLLPDLEAVEILVAGVEHGNAASEGLLRSLGFVARATASEPGFTDFELHRSESIAG
jgi:RimJ/RimL family protein N-acetyltransferase